MRASSGRYPSAAAQVVTHSAVSAGGSAPLSPPAAAAKAAPKPPRGPRRPPPPDIATPPIPSGLDWVGEPVESIDRLVATSAVLVHFFDVAQLNSIRTLPYLRSWHERYGGDGLAMIGVHSPRFPF